MLGIHIGDNTHHHDKLIYPVSFRPMKRTVSNPVKPIPDDDEELVSLLIYCFILRKSNDCVTVGISGPEYGVEYRPKPTVPNECTNSIAANVHVVSHSRQIAPEDRRMLIL